MALTMWSLDTRRFILSPPAHLCLPLEATSLSRFRMVRLISLPDKVSASPVRGEDPQEKQDGSHSFVWSPIPLSVEPSSSSAPSYFFAPLGLPAFSLDDLSRHSL